MPSLEKKLCVILGGGGHARVVIETLLITQIAIPYAVLDTNPRLWGKEILGVPILGNDEKLSEIVDKGIRYFAIGLGSIGDNRKRQQLFDFACSHHLKPLNIKHPTSICSPDVILGEGCQLLAGSIVNIGAELGKNVIVNSGAIIEHDSFLGHHVHVAPGAKMASHVHIGHGAHIGLGATLLQGISIGEESIVGAGAVVTKNVASRTTVIGVPARVLEK